MLLEEAEYPHVVDELGTGDVTAVATLPTSPDVVLVDMDALDAARFEAVAAAVHAATPAPLLVVSGECEAETKQTLVRIGAMGCVAKDSPAEVLVKAVERVCGGGVWFDRSTLAEVVSGIRQSDAGETTSPEAGVAPLTGREVEIVEGVAEGLKNRQIAKRLFISEVTVRHHLTSIYAKVGVANRQKLMLYAFERGIVRPPGGVPG
jgi:DNA-binding NarL/FixJ family response regulator